VDIVQELLGDTPVLRIKGDLDRPSAPALEEALHAHLRTGIHRLVLDLSGCPYVDSGGLATIMVTSGELRDDGMLAVIAPSLSIRRLLELVGLYEQKRCGVFKAEEEAVAALSLAPQASGF
jgi:anti-anti-sigma factor